MSVVYDEVCYVCFLRAKEREGCGRKRHSDLIYERFNPVTHTRRFGLSQNCHQSFSDRGQNLCCPWLGWAWNIIGETLWEDNLLDMREWFKLRSCPCKHFCFWDQKNCRPAVRPENRRYRVVGSIRWAVSSSTSPQCSPFVSILDHRIQVQDESVSALPTIVANHSRLLTASRSSW